MRILYNFFRPSIQNCGLLILWIFLDLAHTQESVVVYDSSVTNWRDWTKNTGEYYGWTTQSSQLDGKPIQAAGVCNVEKKDNDNWYLSPFIARKEAKSLRIEIQFTIRGCSQFPDPTQLQNCEETFGLWAKEAGSTADKPTEWNVNAFKFVKTVAPDRRWEENSDAPTMINVESIPLELTSTSAGVYLALHDTGSCVMIIRLRVFYLACPQLTVGLSTFPRTVAGQQYDVEKAQMQCAEGALLPETELQLELKKICHANGKWHTVSVDAVCQCKPGFHQVGKHQCQPCPIGQYKPGVGPDPCFQCPLRSLAPIKSSTNCSCDTGYFRNANDTISSPCTSPPSAPKNLKIENNDDAQLDIIWDQPGDLGSRLDLEYQIECTKCPANGHLVFSPINSTLGAGRSSVHVIGLEASSLYQFSVYAINGVSKIAKYERLRFASVKVETKPATGTLITNTRVEVGKDKTFRFSWQTSPSTVSLQYQVQLIQTRSSDLPDTSSWSLGSYRRKRNLPDTSSWSSRRRKRSVENITVDYLFTTEPQCQLKKLKSNLDYKIRVRVKTAEGWGPYSDFVLLTAEKANSQVPIQPESGGSGVGDMNQFISIVMGVLLSVVLVTAVFLLLACLVRRKMWFRFVRSNISFEKSPTECDMLPYNNLHAHIPSRTSHYVDPHTYEDPNEAVKEFTKEMDPTWIMIESVIGGGEFGDVCRGKLQLPGKEEELVAIKTLKPGSSDKSKMDFLTEASIMGQFDHCNVISLKGVVTKLSPIMILTEFMEHGSLDAFLRDNDNKFTVLQLLGLMRGIASGMSYLAGIGYVHRDLAARNILVNSSFVCKVADFGLSREIESDDTDGAYTTKGGKIPVRWTAPEAINFHKFTSSSDVWSFGVVMWEVLSYGERPYWTWTNQDVIRALESGYRLPPPMGCPPPIHNLMRDCWRQERSARPKFPIIVASLDALIRSPDLLRQSRDGVQLPALPYLGTFNNNNCQPPRMTISSGSLTTLQSNMTSRSHYAHAALPLLQPPVRMGTTLPHSRSVQGIARPVPISNGNMRTMGRTPMSSYDSLSSHSQQHLLSHHTTVEEWLMAIKMDRYIDLFRCHGITTMDYVSRLSLDDLVAMGITLVGHQKKILTSIQTLRAHLCSLQMSEGFLV